MDLDKAKQQTRKVVATHKDTVKDAANESGITIILGLAAAAVYNGDVWAGVILVALGIILYAVRRYYRDHGGSRQS